MAFVFRNIRSGKRQAAITQLDSITRKEIEETLKKQVRPALVKSHELVVADWKNKVTFSTETSIRADVMKVFVFPTGPNKQIWIFVDQGTKPHPIEIKTAPRLVFEWGGKGSYNPKTLARPARTVSGGGTVSNPQTIYAKRVEHPGTEAREFSKQIAEDIEPDFKREIENAFRRTANKVQE